MTRAQALKLILLTGTYTTYPDWKRDIVLYERRL